MRIAEIELCQIAVNVRLTPMVIGANHAAFQDAEKVLCGVGVNAASLGKFAARMKDGAMLRELTANAPVETGIV